MVRKIFYPIIIALIIVDGYLLANPNVLGKVGLIIYKYHYLRTFPKALFTVSLAVAACILIVLTVHFLVSKLMVRKIMGTLILLLFFVLSVVIFVKVYVDFSTWSYGHTGAKFRYGAYLLPVILALIFLHGLLSIRKPLPEPLREGTEIPE